MLIISHYFLMALRSLTHERTGQDLGKTQYIKVFEGLLDAVMIFAGLCYVSSYCQDQRADQEDELNRKLIELSTCRSWRT